MSEKEKEHSGEVPFTPSGQQRFAGAGGEVLPSFWRSFGSFLIEIIKVLVIAAAIVVPVRYFLIQPFVVKGASMEPNFRTNQYLVIDRLSYRLHDVRRGDVVVLNNPREESEFFIKRVIGLPGEKVEIRNGRVSISNAASPLGFTLDESEYLPAGRTTNGNTAITLGEEEYYVLGDNRAASLDSRSFGTVSKNKIVGRVWIRAWPLNSMTTFHTPTYGLNKGKESRRD